MSRLFVTGGSGLLGANIIKNAAKQFEVHGSYNKHKVSFENCSLHKVNITEKSQVHILREIKPDLIVHCAAFVDIDGCEKKPEYAYQQNVVGTENVVDIAENIGSFLIHISTDSVFDGTKGNYSEVDQTNPVNVYGKTKLDAEQIVQKSNVQHCIVRTNIYGWNKLNKSSLAEWMINKLENNEELSGFYDVHFTPMLVNNLAKALFEIYEQKIQGVLHVSGSESCSKFQFAEKIVGVFHLNKNLLKPISINDIDLVARRGNNLSLNTRKAQSVVKTKLFNIQEGLCEMKKLRDEGYVDELKAK